MPEDAFYLTVGHVLSQWATGETFGILTWAVPGNVRACSTHQ